jgi:hypothetical protein
MNTPAAAKSATEQVDLQRQEWLDHLWKRRHVLVYKARLSVLYHLKRARFFDGFDKFASIATALSATSAVVALLQTQDTANKILAMATAALSLVPIIYNPAQHARHHAELVGRFRAVLAQMERVGEHWTESQCNEFGAAIVEIEAAEPAPLGVLVAECQNQLGLALPPDQRGKAVELRFWHHLVKHFVDVTPSA